MKRSYVVTLDDPDHGEREPVFMENERAKLAALIRWACSDSVHVTVDHSRGLPPHPGGTPAEKELVGELSRLVTMAQRQTKSPEAYVAVRRAAAVLRKYLPEATR